jgi:prepilin-type N-terminal cleavage/methylation domain-containing protein
MRNLMPVRITVTKGFTLIELVVIIIILGILAAIAVPRFIGTKKGAAIATLKSDIRNLQTAQETHMGKNGKYFDTTSTAAEPEDPGAVWVTADNEMVNYWRTSPNVTVDSLLKGANNGGYAVKLSLNGYSCAFFVGNATGPTVGAGPNGETAATSKKNVTYCNE